MTSRDDMAVLVAELRDAAQWRDNRVKEVMLRAASALDSLTSRSMEAGGGGAKPLTDDQKLLNFANRLEGFCDFVERKELHDGWQISDIPEKLRDIAIKRLTALSPVPGEGVTDAQVERLTEALHDQSNSIESDTKGDGRVWLEGYFDLRKALTAALSPPVKGKE